MTGPPLTRCTCGSGQSATRSTIDREQAAGQTIAPIGFLLQGGPP
jgi:hypothetical protein